MVATADTSNYVDPEDACPRCSERDADLLVWRDDDRVECQRCGAVYEPGRRDHERRE